MVLWKSVVRKRGFVADEMPYIYTYSRYRCMALLWHSLCAKQGRFCCCIHLFSLRRCGGARVSNTSRLFERVAVHVFSELKLLLGS